MEGKTELVMNITANPEVKAIMQVAHIRPAVSIIMPFEPKMGIKSELAHGLKLAVDKVERMLRTDYPADISALVVYKLRRIIKDLNFNTHKKSIAVYVSPVFEKLLYLDIPVEEKIVVDESFAIRDVVYSKKQLHKYLVLVLSAKESRMFIGTKTGFVRIVSNKPESAHAYFNDMPERVSNFSDLSARKEALLNKFLMQVDNALDIVLNAYHLPLFVLGTKRVLGHFNKLTKHAKNVNEYVHGNYEESTIPQLKQLLAPYIENWEKVIEKDMLNQLDKAAAHKKLATGMIEVWKQAMQHKGQLLVVEKNFMYAAEHVGERNLIRPANRMSNNFSYLKDAVDDIIEKVLEDGGDVEFVDKDVLKDYNHIALIKKY